MSHSSHAAFDFQTSINRHNTNSSKWNKYAGRDIFPMWVADMDFACAPAITKELQERVKHNIFGYPYDEYMLDTIVQYLKRQYEWDISEHDITVMPGLVCSLNLVCSAFCAENDGVLTHIPIYPPFMSSAKLRNRTSQCVMLAQPNGQNNQWHIDFEATEKAITPSTKIFMLCYPHNPTGRVWTIEELRAIGALCEKYDLLICSDEIHCDLILDTTCTQHIPFAKACPEFAQRTITLMAPSKTFNIAGLGASCVIIENKKLKAHFDLVRLGLIPKVNVLGASALVAAWSGECEDWRQALLVQLRQNAAQLAAGIHTLDGITTYIPQATHLMWLDCRHLLQKLSKHPTYKGKSAFELFELAGIGGNNGQDFGMDGFVRLNFACSPNIISQAIERLQRFFHPLINE